MKVFQSLVLPVYFCGGRFPYDPLVDLGKKALIRSEGTYWK